MSIAGRPLYLAHWTSKRQVVLTAPSHRDSIYGAEGRSQRRPKNRTAEFDVASQCTVKQVCRNGNSVRTRIGVVESPDLSTRNLCKPVLTSKKADAGDDSNVVAAYREFIDFDLRSDEITR
jgi:hypothetical protein